MDKPMLIDKLLRRNPCRRDGGPGSWKLRLTLCDGPFKGRRLQIGLGTRSLDEARVRAKLILHAYWLAGGRFGRSVQGASGEIFDIGAFNRPSAGG